MQPHISFKGCEHHVHMGRGWRWFHHAKSFGSVLSPSPSIDSQPQHTQHLPHPTIPNECCANRHQAPPHLNLFLQYLLVDSYRVVLTYTSKYQVYTLFLKHSLLAPFLLTSPIAEYSLMLLVLIFHCCFLGILLQNLLCLRMKVLRKRPLLSCLSYPFSLSSAMLPVSRTHLPIWWKRLLVSLQFFITVTTSKISELALSETQQFHTSRLTALFSA